MDTKVGEEGRGATPGAREEVSLRPLESPSWSRFLLKDCSPWRGGG